MERYTEKIDGLWTVLCEYGDLPCPVVTQDVIDLLAAYEDTGLSPEEIREFVEDVIRQFAYGVKVDGRCAYSTGGLSTLEWAFSILGWPDPKPTPECECQEEGCHEWAVGGRPTPDGYKCLCSRHFADYKAREEAEV